MAVYRSDEL